MIADLIIAAISGADFRAGRRPIDPGRGQAAMTPGYWMHETSGMLRPAVEAYLRHEPMTPEMIDAMRAYLRQWIAAPVWADGMAVDNLRHGIDLLVSRETIDVWLDLADQIGIDPL